MFSERKGQRMGENRAYCDDDDDEVFNGGFMKLLGCEDVVFEKRVRVEEEFLFSPPCSLSSSSTTASSSSSSSSSAGCCPQMLQFGGGHEEFLLFNSNNSYSLSAAAAAAPSPTGRSRARPCKKVEINGGGGRKPKAAGFAGTIKVRKEKLGERINALQQLISPFGKTDTATVLHEAIGYIRFLHDQVQVLSSPYMQQFPLSSHQTEGGGDLRSRGLCLVPVSCTEDVANKSSISTGADLWSPAALGGGSSSSSSGSKH